MHLTIRDVSSFLNVSDATVTGWIKQRGLPAQHVGGQYRFHRVELLEWTTANRIKVSLELFDQLEMAGESTPNLVKALEAGGIFGPLRNTNRQDALRALVEVIPLPNGVDREMLLQLFEARESAHSTAIGDGIAVPHVRNPIVLHVDAPMAVLCYLEKPVDFQAPDGKPVHVLFSLICPTMRSHLQMLARLSNALHDRRFKDAVLRHARPQEILEEARRFEAALATQISEGQAAS